tara:strand:+ start:3228 stop:3518 length:291 start_codon:yes stop_codon:yes gene_type:complete
MPEQMITESTLWKLLGGMATAIIALCAFIKTLISGKAEEIKNVRAECKNGYDEELGRAAEMLASEKADKAVLADEKEQIQREFLEFVKQANDRPLQ